MTTQRTQFNIGSYRCMFGVSQSQTGFSLWLWNGYYWQVEIADANDLDGAKHAMEFKIADRKAELSK